MEAWWRQKSMIERSLATYDPKSPADCLWSRIFLAIANDPKSPAAFLGSLWSRIFLPSAKTQSINAQIFFSGLGLDAQALSLKIVNQ